MNKIKSLSLLLVLCLILGNAGSNGLFAQERAKRLAKKNVEQLAYSKAVKHFQKILKKNPDNEDAILGLANCYWQTNDFENAAPYYEKAMGLDYNSDPEILFRHGHCLLQAGRYEEAGRAFGDFASLSPDDPRGMMFVESLKDFDKLLKDSIHISVDILPINSKNSDFSAFPYDEGIVFASSREEGSPYFQNFDWMDQPFLDLYYTKKKTKEKEDGEEEEEKDKEGKVRWSVPVPLQGDINTRYHESNFAYGSDSSKIFFTRNNFYNKKKGKDEDGIIRLKIFSAEMYGNKAVAVNEFPYNSDHYSITHPSLSADGNTLYFASDKADPWLEEDVSFGGKDIYYSEFSEGAWSTPVNMGSLVNTPGNEVFPFIHEDGNFFFASDGHPGLGHLDIFKVSLNSLKKQVYNLGYPINSPFDDFCIWLDGERENGYFASNRPNGEGDDDIYSVTIERPEIEIRIIDRVAHLPIEGAEVIVDDLQYGSTDTFLTDSLGWISFKTDFGGDFTAVVKTLEYPDENLEMSTRSETGQLLFSYEAELYNPPPAITAIVIDDATGERIQDAHVEIIKLISNDTIFRNTDRNGRFAAKLEKHTYYELNVKMDGYLNYSDRWSTTQYTMDGDTVIPLKMQPIKMNEPIVLENIHYDFDKWTIRFDAYDDLIGLAVLMDKNPLIKIELSSHTDSRGSDAYNLRLSRRRAAAARYFLIDLGVAPERVVAVGYGETKLVNKCRNGIPCTADQHYQNRRTEFKVIGYLDEDIDVKNSKLETNEEDNEAPEYVPEDPGNYGPDDIIDNKGTTDNGGDGNNNSGNESPGLSPIINPDPQATEEKTTPTPDVGPEPAPQADPEPAPLPEPEPVAEKVVEEISEPEAKMEPETVEPVEGPSPVNEIFEDPEKTPEGPEIIKLEREDEAETGAVVEDIKSDLEEKGTAKVEEERKGPTAEEKAAAVDDTEEVLASVEKPTEPEKLDEPVKEEANDDPAAWGDSVAEEEVEGDEESSSVSSAPENEKPANTTAVLPDMKYNPAISPAIVTYRIQIGAFRGKLFESSLKKMGDYRPYLIEKTVDGLNVYLVGEYMNYQQAMKAKEHLAKTWYNGIFLTGWKNGKSLTQEALQEEIRKAAEEQEDR